MALAKKIREYLKVSDYEKAMEQMFDVVCQAFGPPDDPIAAKIAKKFREVMDGEKDFIMSLQIQFYKNNFSESEMDELIKMISQPVYKKIRDLTPKAMEQSMNHFRVVGERFSQDLQKMIASGELDLEE